MSLNKNLSLLHKEVLESLSPDVRKQLINEEKKLFNNYLEGKTLKVGSQVPNVFFRDENLKSVYLTDLLKEHHLVLSFFRGTWCPYCNLELISLAKINNEIEKRGARLVAVSPELHRYSEDTLKKNKIDFPVFTDLNNKAADEFGLVFNLSPEYREIYQTLNIHLNILNSENNWTLPMPATFIISKDGVITSTYVNADYTQRMEPNDILEQLDLLSRS